MSYEDVLFQNPGPTNIPGRVMDAMRRPVIDYRGKAFRPILEECIDGVAQVLRTRHPIVIFPATGHGAWEAALVNLFSPGDKVLSVSQGLFGEGWARYARRFGLIVSQLVGDPRRGIDYGKLEEALRADQEKTIKGVLITHCETSTGGMTDCRRIREILDALGHPALLLVDVISSLGCADFCMDEWGVDVAAGASQKGLMIATGLCFTGISPKARAASKNAALPRAYWDWDAMLSGDRQVNFPGTAPVQLFFGLQEALRILFEEGLENVLARHERYGAAMRAAVGAWSQGGMIELYLAPALASPAVTTIAMRQGTGTDRVREIALEQYKLQLGSGLGALADRVFRIAHMGQLSASQLMGVIGGVELALSSAGIMIGAGAAQAAAAHLHA